MSANLKIGKPLAILAAATLPFAACSKNDALAPDSGSTQNETRVAVGQEVDLNAESFYQTKYYKATENSNENFGRLKLSKSIKAGWQPFDRSRPVVTPCDNEGLRPMTIEEFNQFRFSSDRYLSPNRMTLSKEITTKETPRAPEAPSPVPFKPESRKSE